jgi:hypothetical protein
VACLRAILQSGTGSRSSLPFSNRGTRRMNPQLLVDQRSYTVLSHFLYSLPEITQSAVQCGERPGATVYGHN